MQNGDRDSVRKTISAYRESIFLCCYAQQALHPCSLVHEMHDRMCVPSELDLQVAIEALEANLMSNENATEYAKRLFKWIDPTLPAIERKVVDAI
jgi:hypothetical protein